MKLTTTAAAWTVTGALGLAVVAGTVAAFADSPVPEPRPAVTVAGVPAPEEPPAASGADTEDGRDDDADRDDDSRDDDADGDDDATQGQSDPTKPRPLASPVSPTSPVSAPSGG